MPLVGADDDAPRARVVVAQDANAIRQFDADPGIVAGLVERGITTLTGRENVADAWRQFAGPVDVVGIKIVARGGPLFAVHNEIVQVVIAGLKSAGVPDNHIIVWDKYQNELLAAGYDINTTSNGVRVLGVIPSSGFDVEATFRSPHAGKIIWGDLLFGAPEEISAVSHFARLVTADVTKLINIAVLSDHLDVGLSGCLFNAAIGSIDNSRRLETSASASAAAIGDILAHDAVRGKFVLHLIDGLLGQYALGPNFHPEFTWHHGAIYFSTDPVALDAIALEEIEKRRQKQGKTPIGPRARYLDLAADRGLGVRDRKRIEVIKPK